MKLSAFRIDEQCQLEEIPASELTLAWLEDSIQRWIEIDADTRTTLYPEAQINYEQVIKVVDVILGVGLTDITFAGVAWDT